MIGVVIATHGRLGEELVRTAEAVVGKLAQVQPVAVDVTTNTEIRGQLKDAIKAVDTGDGVLLLTDLLGGSPTNLCASFLTERQVEIVTGVNLPMLLKLDGLRGTGKPIAAVAQELVEAGRKAIGHVSETLRRAM